MNGTVVAAAAKMTTAKGIMTFDGARFVGNMEMRFTADTKKGSQAKLTNVAVLDCSLCHPADAIDQLEWSDLPMKPPADALFLAAPPVEPRGISFVSQAASLTALLAISSTLNAVSDSGDLELDEYVLTASTPATTRNGTPVGVLPPIPQMTLDSRRGNVELNNLIASSAGKHYNISLISYAGNVKGLFTGGTLNGQYSVVTEPGSIGRAGITIDNEVTPVTRGRVGGVGNASILMSYNYGDLSLIMYTKVCHRPARPQCAKMPFV